MTRHAADKEASHREVQRCINGTLDLLFAIGNAGTGNSTEEHMQMLSKYKTVLNEALKNVTLDTKRKRDCLIVLDLIEVMMNDNDEW